MSARSVYRRLSFAARERIGWSDVTIADYSRHFAGDLDWRGDACGCPDDRCIGYHHDEHEDCACLEVSVGEVEAAARETRTTAAAAAAR